jgi:hypothetical protein
MKRACVETKEKSQLKRRETKCRRRKKKDYQQFSWFKKAKEFLKLA